MVLTVSLHPFCGFLKEKKELGMVVHVYNPRLWEAEARGLQVQCQLGLHNENLCQTPFPERDGGEREEG
jgi:hypothetical protein